MSGDHFTLEQVRKMSAGSDERTSYSLADIQAMGGSSDGQTRREKTTTLGRASFAGGVPAVAASVAEGMGTPQGRAEGLNFLVGGPLRAATSIGNTILRGKSWLEDQLYDAMSEGRTAAPSPFGAAQRERMASQDQFFAERFNPQSVAFKAGQIGTEIAGTAGAGPVVAAPVRAVGGGTRGMTALANAIESGGMRTGAQGMGRAADMGIRSAGGGIAGAASLGLVDPESVGLGFGIGASLPPAAKLVNAGLTGMGQAARTIRPAPGVSGADVRAARNVASMAGAESVDDITGLSAALRQTGPQIIPGAQTVPEVLQVPGVSQLQRSVKAVHPDGFVARDAEREFARREVLERIAPVGQFQEVAEQVGNNIAEYAIPAHNAAKAQVRAKFGAVDPFNESAVILPLNEMQAAKDKFLGPGTFGAGGMAQQAINEAQRIGTQTVPGVRAAASGRQPQDVLQAVRKLGGINPNSAGGMSAEITELGRKQSGTTGLVSARGRTIDEVAELMHERGFIGSPDPSELLDAVRNNLSGRPVYAADVADNAFQFRLERSMGDAPGTEQIAKPVTFDQLQNLRSSIGEQWRIAVRSGNAKEAAALDQQRRAIDQALDNLAAGNGQPGEFFAPDMVRNYRDARAAHAAKEQRFKTGPQAALFRTGSDGLPVAQGAEVPGRFFNPKASQMVDAQSFRRLVREDAQLMADLRSYAVSDAARQTDRFGNLTSAKFNRWLEAREGATGQIFTEQQRAWLRAIADDLRRADSAESLGRSSGSDTAQKAASMVRLGLTDNPAARWAASRIPFGNNVLDFVSGPARTARAERLSSLLLDPERIAALLDVYVTTQRPKATGLLAGAAADPLLYRGAPLLLTAPGR